MGVSYAQMAVIPRRRRERVKATKCDGHEPLVSEKAALCRYAPAPCALRFDSDALNSRTARENGVSCVRRHR